MTKPAGDATTPLEAEPAKLKIALQTLDYPPDAVVSSIGLYTQALAAALTVRGHEVHVLSRGDGDSSERAGPLTVHRLGPARAEAPKRMGASAALGLFFTGGAREWRYRQRLAKKLSELVKTGQVTLIEAADCAADAVGYRPGRHPGVPFVVRLHGPTAVGELFDKTIPEFARRVVRRLERRLLLRATHLCAPSQAAAGLFRREMALGAKPIAVYPNIPTFSHLATAPEVTTDPNLVLYVGRLSPVKGVHLLVQAVPGVLDRHPQARFVLAGPDGPTSQGYLSAQDYLLSLLPPPCRHAVSFTGYLPPTELARYYERAALCVAPSLFESFGYSCLEAMAHGKAVIGSPTGSMAEMLDHGRCGLLYTPPAIDALSDQMVRLLKDPGLRRRLGEAARARILRRYRPEAIASRVEVFYRRALADLAGG